jgi:hypothetical protein
MFYPLFKIARQTTEFRQHGRVRNKMPILTDLYNFQAYSSLPPMLIIVPGQHQPGYPGIMQPDNWFPIGSGCLLGKAGCGYAARPVL